MFRLHLLCALVLAPLVGPAAVSAQAGPTRAPAGCTYETCALRVEPGGFLSGPKLLRGRAGERVGSLGMFGGGVDTLLAGPDSAAAYGRQYVSNIRVANTFALLGAVAFVVASVHSDGFRDTDDTDAAIALTGAGLSLVAIPFVVRASRSLSRAVWHYNSVLPNR
jgi:hypothetical protein